MNDSTTTFPLKQCSKKDECVNPLGSWLPATVEYFQCLKKGTSILSARCKVCIKQYRDEYAELNKEQLRGRARERYWKDPQKHRDEANARREKNLDAHRERDRQYRLNNPERAKKKDYDRYWKDPEANRLRSKRYAEDHPEWRREYNRRYAQEHRSEIVEKNRLRKAQNRDKSREYNRKHYAENKGKHLAIKQRREARKRQLPDTMTATQVIRAFEYWDNSCAYCGRKADFWTVITLDHWIALTDSRPDNPGTSAINLIPACHAKKDIPYGDPVCNMSKHNRDPVNWLTERFGKRRASQIIKKVEAYFRWVKEQDGID